MVPSISIIVPVYNAEKYIAKCLDSLQSQTYKNIQIICTDDGSTDHSPQILDEYALIDARIHVIHKTNEGVSLARNAALRYATGDYLMFVDGDDWIDPDTCAVAVEAMNKHRADVVMWSYIRELANESRKKNVLESDAYFDQVGVKEKLYRRMVGLYGAETSHPENADALCTVWGKLYKRDIIESNQIRFHDIRELGTYEDGLFNLNVFSKAKSVVFIDRHFYHYRRGNNLSITTAYNAKMPEQWDTLFGILLNHIEENELDSSFYVALSNRIVFSLISLGINEIEKHDSTADTVRRINRLIKASHYQNAIAEFDAQYLPFHWRVFFACAKLKFATGVYLLLWVIQRIRGR